MIIILPQSLKIFAVCHYDMYYTPEIDRCFDQRRNFQIFHRPNIIDRFKLRKLPYHTFQGISIRSGRYYSKTAEGIAAVISPKKKKSEFDLFNLKLLKGASNYS